MSQDLRFSNENERWTAFDMDADAFRRSGHELIDTLADYYASLKDRRVTVGVTPSEVHELLGDEGLPKQGTDPTAVLSDVARILLEKSLFTPHPRFWGYITGSAAPSGVLSDMLAAAINPNVGAWILSPVASEIERQAIRWLAELLGYPTTCGGLMVSGGNMANFVCFLAARRAAADWDLRADGIRNGTGQMTAYVSGETHTWIHKAADLFGLGMNAIRWIPTDKELRMDIEALKETVGKDRAKGFIPAIVVGAGGTVGTGAVDPLFKIAEFCREEKIWFHVDGAYGAPAAALPEAPADLKGLSLADSVALDPHKWLYAPLEAGCALVRDPQHLINAFSFHPEYYRFDSPEGEQRTNFFEYGMQNSRGFRALKVWVQLRQAGKDGIVEALSQDIALSEEMGQSVRANPELEVWTQNLSILTFRYVPADLKADAAAHQEYLNTLNTEILDRIQSEGDLFVSNAVIRGTFVLRACIVNFRTTLHDVRSVPGVIVAAGRAIDSEKRNKTS